MGKQTAPIKLNVRYIEGDYSRLPERTATIDLHSAKLALLLVDVQNDFLSEAGMYDAKGANIDQVRTIVEPTRRVVETCRRRGVKIVYTQHCFRSDLCDVGAGWANASDLRSLVHRGQVAPGTKVGPKDVPAEKLGSLIRGTWNAAIIDELAPREGDIIIDSKHKYTAFYQTDLELILRTLGIEALLIGGVSTAVCVESTLRDAYFRDFLCVLLTDCTWEKTADLQVASETIVKLHFGCATTSSEVVKALIEETS